MKLVAQVRLQPTLEQADALLRTLEIANAACNHISSMAWQTQTFGKFALQKRCYTTVRERFDLAAQMTIRCLVSSDD